MHAEVQFGWPVSCLLLPLQFVLEFASGHSNDDQIQRSLPLTVVDNGDEPAIRRPDESGAKPMQIGFFLGGEYGFPSTSIEVEFSLRGAVNTRIGIEPTQ
jgi:hypothetical protein